MDKEELKQGQQNEEPQAEGAKSVINKTIQGTQKGIGAISKTAATIQSGLSAAEAETTTTTAGAAAAAATEEALATTTGVTISSGTGSLAALVIGVILIILLFVMLILVSGGVPISSNPSQNTGTSKNNSLPLPQILTFDGGYAYLSCSSTSRTSCPKFDKGSNITVYAFVFLDPNKTISFDPNKAIISVKLDTDFLSQITQSSITPHYDSLTTPFLTRNFFQYNWKLSTLQKLGGNSYLISISNKISPGIGNGETTVSLTLKGFGTVTASSGSDTTSGDIYAGMTSAPSANNCKAYGGIMSIIETDTSVAPFKSQLKPSNYGDPQCTYSDKNLRSVIADTLNKPSTDPFVNFWMDIADCESSSPNGHGIGNHNSKADCASLGSWGKFQMCGNNPPGNPWTHLSARGDVTWQRQAQNAIWLNQQQGNSFEYWGTARCLCAFDKYKNQPTCSKLWSLQRSCEKGSNPGSCSYIRNNCNNSCITSKGA